MQNQTRCDIMSMVVETLTSKRVLFRLTASGAPTSGAVIFFYFCSDLFRMYLLVINGFSLYRTDGTDDILLKLKKKKVYIRNVIRELSKDVFYLFYHQKQELIKALYILSSISSKLRLPSLN